MPDVEFIHVGIGGVSIKQLIQLLNYYEIIVPKYLQHKITIIHY